MGQDFSATGNTDNLIITGTAFRSAGAYQGTYSGSSTHPTFPVTYTFNGTYSLSGAEGSISYDAEAGTFSAELDYIVPPDNSVSLAGSSTYTINDADSITIDAFTIYEVPPDDSKVVFSPSMEVSAVTLTRSGSTYRGDLELDDGNLDTPWADYTQHRLEIIDDNDSNQNGIPDLSDTVPEPNVTLGVLAAMICIAGLRTRSRHTRRD